MSITINHQTNTISATSGSITIDGATPQPQLVSGTNIKTINGTSLLGSGDLTISGGGGNYVPIDSSTGAATLPTGTTAQRPASPTVGMIRYNSDLKVNEVYTESQITHGTYAWRAIPTGDTIIQASTNGEATYTAPGTYSWVCPAGVTAVNVVCVGGGGGSAVALGAGGGGGLAWCNNIPVTPGASYTVVVGAGGAGGTSSTSPGVTGGTSSFINTNTIAAYGGDGGRYIANATANGGGFAVSSAYGSSGGGSGGNGGGSNSTTNNPGGGGAGGYSGFGGSGASFAAAYGIADSGTGGGGGGGAVGTSNGAGAGGGVGLYGAGTNGAAGASNSSSATRGGGGSGGTGGGILNNAGGVYGGGGAPDAGSGGDGAVRIIWGPNRAFPSTNTGIL